ncbi:hypothetical protein DPMN_129024 [Dreissena polymorpha]|uniref:Uncharacterized protein n=1 Tax=Dreissena polymorpha TaxID=45954 RepID=A0A9D4H1Z0_DREPO|nr:hypothetical protein DPMN_129024 [Dreissena polymorpha]
MVKDAVGEEKEAMNSDISLEEVEGAISRFKRGKALGPDQIPAECFINSGDNLRETLTVLFIICWDQGKCPREWKEALVKFLR